MILLTLLQTHLNVVNLTSIIHQLPSFATSVNLETFTNYVDVGIAPLVTYPKSTTQLVFIKSNYTTSLILHSLESIAF
jgi:hypothetical protein